jgi:hypothetical protein
MHSLLTRPLPPAPPSRRRQILRAVLQPVLLRRTKQTQIGGQPIVQLPGREQQLVQPQFSVQERSFYKQVRGPGGLWAWA